MKHINSQLENELRLLNEKNEREMEKTKEESKQLKSKVSELQKYHDFFLNEKKKVMKFENEIIIKDSQITDYKSTFK